ncbi:sulfide:quinone oxidoreductase, mitochondrial-like [Elysia marginata]|uniref:Sulfide:quinone oxidoreductase, mitochondrial n=1 Tax=Elysia marginata TaxID=1093978 RepID=A0AAV4FIK5_9GAST|nr:sulfide:quinone oxidoreductase, mitochondrial-like [Elysia marginata]
MASSSLPITRLAMTCLARHQPTAAILGLKPSMSVHHRSQASLYSSEAVPRSKPANSKYKVVIVGGGSGGCAVAAKLSSLGKSCAVVEPSDLHYYQPIWTLVGGGLKGFQSSVRPMGQVLPSSIDWIQDKAVKFDPENNNLELSSGDKVKYDYLVVAMGIQLDYDKVNGLVDALENDPVVVSNYTPRWVNKTFPAMQGFRGGNAIFTYPNTPIKCAGAPQKIMYLTEEFLRTTGMRENSNIIFNTAQGVIFGVKKYADALQKVIQSRNIQVNYKHNLVSVDHKERTAVFANLDKDNELVPFKYNFLHVTPPMSSPDVLKKSPLVNEGGWVDLHKHTLQHVKFSNVFGLGDCTSLPNSKTAAAVAVQCGILHKNLTDTMEGKKPTSLYNGYASCPLITSREKCILAEFDYNLQPQETLPINQGVERKLAYGMKAYLMPELYWQVMMKGKWNGPATIRKVLHLGMSKSSKLQA